MRASEVHFPKDLAEALEILKRPGILVFAGGTGILREQGGRGISLPEEVMFLQEIAELKRTSLTERFLEIGAAVTLSELLELGDSALPPLLAEAARNVGSPASAISRPSAAISPRGTASWIAGPRSPAWTPSPSSGTARGDLDERQPPRRGGPETRLPRGRPRHAFSRTARAMGRDPAPQGRPERLSLVGHGGVRLRRPRRERHPRGSAHRLRRRNGAAVAVPRVHDPRQGPPLSPREAAAIADGYKALASDLPEGLGLQFGVLVDGAFGLLSR